MSRLFAVLALIVVVGTAYAPARRGVFVWDDHTLIEQDQRCARHLAECFRIPYFPTSPFLEVRATYYRPLSTISFRILSTFAVMSSDEHWQHTFNIVIHAVNAVLLLVLGLRFGFSLPRASAVAGLWALFPRSAEVVAWISGRADLLATMFVLLALIFVPRKTPRYVARQMAASALSAICLFLALLAKEVAVAGVVAVGVLMLARAAEPRRAVARAVATVAPPLVSFFVLRAVAVPMELPPRDVTFATSVEMTFETLARYVSMTLRFLSPWSATGAFGHVSPDLVAAGAVIAVGGGWGILNIFRRRNAALSASLALCLTSLALVLHLFPLGLHGALTADRLLYLPTAGMGLAVAAAVPVDSRYRLASVLSFAVASTAMFVVTRKTATLFTDELTLWINVAEQSNELNTGPRSSLAALVRDRGMPQLACQLFESARRDLDRSDRRGTISRRRAAENLAACWGRVGRYEESAVLYRELAAEHPTVARIALGLGYAELHVLHFDRASAAFRRAIELDRNLFRLADNMRAESDRAAAEYPLVRDPSADPVRRARFFVRVGRSVEAEHAWIQVVNMRDAPDVARWDALSFLLADGTLEAAEAAYVVYSRDFPIDANITQRLAIKRAHAQSVAALEPRIAHLVR